MNSYIIRIYPKGLFRKCWRKVICPGTMSLGKFVYFMLGLFSFDRDHLWELFTPTGCFVCDGVDWGEPAEGRTLDDLELEKGDGMLLHYDFGDDWEFCISVQKREETEEKVEYDCLDGRGTIYQYGYDDDDGYDDDEDE